MKNKKHLVMVLLSTLLVGGMSGCGTTAALPNANSAQMGASSPQTQSGSSPILAAYAEDGGDTKADEDAYAEQFKTYEQFGMVYDAEKNELYYHGKAVRWFEDYYTIFDGVQVGSDFFNENGVVDVYAVRDFTSIVRAEDGSFDPSGKLVDVKEFSEAEFTARDIEAIKNPPSNVALSGYPPSEKELEERAKEYEAFCVTYDIKNDQWYFNDEKVRFFLDVLTSNGEGLTSGRFKGAIRTLGSADGTVDIYTVRDFAHPDDFGNGTLIGVEKYSQAEFDEHTRTSNAPQSSSGTCVVTQE